MKTRYDKIKARADFSESFTQVTTDVLKTGYDKDILKAISNGYT